MGFRTKQVIRRKFGGHLNNYGDYVAGEPKILEIQASVQPVNRIQYANVEPYGGRSSNLVEVYTATELFPTKQQVGDVSEVEGDVLIYHNRLWRCIECDVFQSNVISHYRAIFQEIDEDE